MAATGSTHVYMYQSFVQANILDTIECSEDVDFLSYGTDITLEDSSGRQTHFLARSNHCNVFSSTCAAVFNISNTSTSPEDKYMMYFRHVETLLPASPLHYYPNEICKLRFDIINLYMCSFGFIVVGSSGQLLNYSLTERNGMVYAFCSSHTEGIEICKIQYSMDTSYSSLSAPVTGPIGTAFPVCIVDLSSRIIYYHQASMMINSTLEIVVRSSDVFTFATTDNPLSNDGITNQERNTTVPKHSYIELKVYQVGLMGLLMVVLVLALAICTGVVIIQNHRGNNDYNLVTCSTQVQKLCAYNYRVLSIQF